MYETSAHILAVGKPSLLPAHVSARLGARGWNCHRAETLQESLVLLRASRFDMVLAAESVADGSGYVLTPTVAELAGTLFVGIPLSGGHLWLPVVEGGKKVLGRRAVNSAMLEPEIEMVATGLRKSLHLMESGSRQRLRGAPAHDPHTPARPVIDVRRPRDPAAA